MIIDTQSRLTCTEPCLSAGVRLPSVAPGLGTSGHAATPPLAFVCGCVWKWVCVCQTITIFCWLHLFSESKSECRPQE